MTWSTALRNHLGRWVGTFALCGCIASTFTVDEAHAETGKESAESMPKGTVGLALLGGETVLAVEAAFGVKKAWVYALGGGLGAVAGGFGGYFIDKADIPEVSTSLLVGGMVFAVPTTIAMLNAAAYKPPKNPEIDEAALMEDAYYLARHEPVPSVVDVNENGNLKLKMPAVSIGPVWSRQTRQMYALPNATQVRVPVFHLTF